MALIQSTAIPSGATDYELEQSLRFDDTATSKLTFTPSSAGNTKLQTVSVWVKRGNLGTAQSIISAGGRFDTAITFDTSDKIQVFTNYAENYRGIQTSAVFRDTSAWYHIVASWDTNNATSTDRHILWVNGVRQAVGEEVAIPQNVDTKLFSATEHTIGTGGRYQDNNRLDAYLAEMHIIDGAVKVPADFGETGTYGEWKPIEYSGSYGTNGFYLPFKQDYTVEGFSAVTYAGTGVAGTYIGGVGFQSDLTWVKNRSSSGENHGIYDAVRGGGKTLYPNLTAAENSSNLLTFTTDGFTQNTGNNVASGNNYVAWNWDMGGSNATNTNGTITSTVRANATYGQSIVSYTGTGSNATIGHGLSSAPELVLLKNRDESQNWCVFHKDLNDGTNSGQYNLFLNLGAGKASGEGFWNNTIPASDVFSVGSVTGANGNSDKMIAYCFHSVSGYSSIGSYTGNANATGPSVTTGFRPAFVLLKKSTSANWFIFDNTRSPTNTIDKVLQADSARSEAQNGTSHKIDFNANGFQLKASGGDTNANNVKYRYMAFADKREYAYWLDQSGNNNDWTSNNLTESDVMVDSPTNNFATMNPVFGIGRQDQITYSEGNLQTYHSATSGLDSTSVSTINLLGKIYAEFVAKTDAVGAYFGVMETDKSLTNSGVDTSSQTGIWIVRGDNGNKANNGSASYFGTAFSNGDIIQIAVDIDAGKIWWGRNGTWGASGNPATGANAAYTNLTDDLLFICGDNYSSKQPTIIANFGQDSSFAGNKTAQGNQDGNSIGDFYYTPPTGFLALCTKNLPAVAVVPSENFSTVLYTGDDGQKSITGVGFQPDFIWFKARNDTYSHELFDAVRGNTKRLVSNTTAAEDTRSTATTFDSDGFTVGTGGDASTNDVKNYVAWNWEANGSGSSNSSGDITSTVSVNADAGFSIVSYTAGSGSAGQTVGHGLSSQPEMIIVKKRTGGTAYGWAVWHTGLSNNNGSKQLLLNDTGAEISQDMFNNDIFPSNSSTVFATGDNNFTHYPNGATYIAYCFHSVDGYSKMGSYTGNGNADGTFVYTGFRVSFVVAKRTDATGNWLQYDNKRQGYNLENDYLYLNSSGAEADGGSSGVDLLSNGFKIRNTYNDMNVSGATYIYLAFAETPFKYSNAR